MKALLIAIAAPVLYVVFINGAMLSEKERFETLVEKALAIEK